MNKVKKPNFYVYVYLDPRKPGKYIYGVYEFDYEPFYVGKGSNGRANSHLNKNKDNSYFDRKIKKIQRCFCSNPIVIKYKEMLMEKEAFAIEIHMIQTIGRHDKKQGPLCNHTDGGDGVRGNKQTEKQKAALLFANLGKKQSKEQIEKRVKHLRGVPRSDDVKKKISLSNKGKTRSPEVKEKLSKIHKNMSEETKKKMSISALNRSEEHRRKIGDFFRGKPLTDEHKIKISKGNKGKIRTTEQKERYSISKRKYCQSTIKNLIELRNYGFTIKSISQKTNIPFSSVRLLLKKGGKSEK